MKLRLTKKFSFEMAHALPQYDGKCHNIHGHTYHLSVTVESTTDVAADDKIPADGLLLDFHQLKEIVERTIVKKYDHSLLLPDNSPYRVDGPTNIIHTPFQPSTENLLLHFRHLLVKELPPQVRLQSIKLAETDSSEAELEM